MHQCIRDHPSPFKVLPMDRLWQDLKYALRGLRRSPGFTATVVVTFALGIGANAAIFSILDLIYLKPPAGVVRPNDVYRLYGSVAPRSGKGARFIFEDFNR